MKENKQLFETLKAGLGNGLICDYLPLSKRSLQGELLTIDFDDHNDYWIRLNVMDKPRTPEFAKPHLFPLSMLTKPIKVKGYNDGKEFHVINELSILSQEHCNDMEQVLLYELMIKVFEGEESYLKLPHYIVERMNVFHIALDLDENQYINASKSKVYD